MKTISVATMKGGEGKSVIAILLSNFLASLGYKVLVADLDPQQSVTNWHYSVLKERDFDKNIGIALFNNSIKNNTVLTNINNVSLVPGSFKLFAMRTMAPMMVSNCLAGVSGLYDFCILDTAGSWDNIVISALTASDFIIAPVTVKSEISLYANREWRTLISEEAAHVANKICCLLNWYSSSKSAMLYIEQYYKIHSMVFDTYLKEAKKQVEHAIDDHVLVTNNKTYNVLYPFLCGLTREVLGYFGMDAPANLPFFSAIDVEEAEA